MKSRSAGVKSRSAGVKVWRSRSAGVKVWRSRSAGVKSRSAGVKVWSLDLQVWRSRSAGVQVWRSSITAAFLRKNPSQALSGKSTLRSRRMSERVYHSLSLEHFPASGDHLGELSFSSLDWFALGRPTSQLSPVWCSISRTSVDQLGGLGGGRRHWIRRWFQFLQLIPRDSSDSEDANKSLKANRSASILAAQLASGTAYLAVLCATVRIIADWTVSGPLEDQPLWLCNTTRISGLNSLMLDFEESIDLLGRHSVVLVWAIQQGGNIPSW